MSKVRLLIIDDSALVREVLSRELGMDDDIEIVGAASDPYDAREKILLLKPDVMTLDIEMPRMNGLEFLRKLMLQHPLPVIMVSALTEHGSQITLNALSAGAVDFVLKPSDNVQVSLPEMMNQLREKIKMAATVNVRHLKNNDSVSLGSVVEIDALAKKTDKVIAIGASTGGTEALSKLISSLPANTPGIVIVQHMPAGFTQLFAERLDKLSSMHVKEAVSGDRVKIGKVLVAEGNKHLQLIRSGGEYRVVCRDGAKVYGHRPSVDVLFRSVAKYAGSNAIGIMLTGMGSDGADAMLKMRESGARTIAQDEATSIIFGMPKEAYQNGGAECLKSLDDIPSVIKEYLEGMV